MAKKNEVAVSKMKDQGLALDSAELAGLQGMGYSERSEDSLIPIISILQDNSAEVKKKHDKFIEGAEPGMLIIRSLQRVYSGEQALVFQPCGFQHMWVEWDGEPGEGRPVRQYLFDERPSDAVETDDPQNPERRIWKMPSGTRLVDTRYHYGHILSDMHPTPAVIPFAGTNHGISRQWTAQMKEIRLPGSDQRAPAWFRKYAISTLFTQRGAQSWYKYAVKDLGWVEQRETRNLGRQLSESVAKMEVSADIESDVAKGDAQDEAPI